MPELRTSRRRIVTRCPRICGRSRRHQAAAAVQIVHSSNRGSRDIEHLGSAHTVAEVELLEAAGWRMLAPDGTRRGPQPASAVVVRRARSAGRDADRPVTGSTAILVSHPRWPDFTTREPGCCSWASATKRARVSTWRSTDTCRTRLDRSTVALSPTKTTGGGARTRTSCSMTGIGPRWVPHSTRQGTLSEVMWAKPNVFWSPSPLLLISPRNGCGNTGRQHMPGRALQLRI